MSNIDSILTSTQNLRFQHKKKKNSAEVDIALPLGRVMWSNCTFLDKYK